jgi:hypothetical protein
MSAKSKRPPYYGLGEAATREALIEAMSVKGLDQEIALLRSRLKGHLELPPPDEGMLLAWINALARALMAKARIEGTGRSNARKHTAAVIRELGSIFLEDPPE